MIKLLLTALLFAQASWSEEKESLPMFEAGFAIGGILLPSYPGSDENTSYVLPVPYLIYRGDILKADRDGGVRGIFYKSEKFELDLGFGGGFPTDGEDNEARDGMDELDWTAEVGPRGKWKLINNEQTRLLLLVPVRYVFSVDFPDTQHQGFVLNPELNLRQSVPYFDNVRLFSSIGFSATTKKLAEYFYTVEPSEATAIRPAFEAEAGYWATNLSLFIGKRFPKKGYNFIGGASWNIYEGARNEDSPLLKDRYTISYFVGFAAKLWESEARGYSD